MYLLTLVSNNNQIIFYARYCLCFNFYTLYQKYLMKTLQERVLNQFYIVIKT